MFTKNFIIIVILAFATPLMFSQEKDAAKHEYVGTKTCGMCHHTEKQGEQLKIWKNSKHSQAYKTLQTKEADEIAKKQGFDKPAIEVDKCLKCHVTAYDVDKSLIGKKYKIEDGVQCETCHGAGGDYKSLKIMKNKELAMKNGLVIHTDKEKFCTTCHNDESPTHKKFDLKEMWAKIKHEIPKK